MEQTASWLRRIGALLVDWFACTLVVIAVVGWEAYSAVGSRAGFWVPVVFVLETAVLTTFSGGSFGKLMTRMRTLRKADGGPVPLHLSFLRALLVALVIPPLVFKPDGRGLHDLVAGSVSVGLADVLRARS